MKFEELHTYLTKICEISFESKNPIRQIYLGIYIQSNIDFKMKGFDDLIYYWKNMKQAAKNIWLIFEIEYVSGIAQIMARSKGTINNRNIFYDASKNFI